MTPATIAEMARPWRAEKDSAFAETMIEKNFSAWNHALKLAHVPQAARRTRLNRLLDDWQAYPFLGGSVADAEEWVFAAKAVNIQEIVGEYRRQAEEYRTEERVIIPRFSGWESDLFPSLNEPD
jgi:hypothetical protein